MTKPLVTMEEYRQQHLYFVEGDPNVDPLIPLEMDAFTGG